MYVWGMMETVEDRYRLCSLCTNRHGTKQVISKSRRIQTGTVNDRVTLDRSSVRLHRPQPLGSVVVRERLNTGNTALLYHL